MTRKTPRLVLEPGGVGMCLVGHFMVPKVLLVGIFLLGSCGHFDFGDRFFVAFAIGDDSHT